MCVCMCVYICARMSVELAAWCMLPDMHVINCWECVVGIVCVACVVWVYCVCVECVAASVALWV